MTAIKSWADLQKEVSVWATHNFGDQEAEEPMLGMVEEAGEFILAQTPTAPVSIGDDENSDRKLGALIREGLIDALGDGAIYALNLAGRCGVDFEECAKMADEGPKRGMSEKELLILLASSCRAVLKHRQRIRGMDFAKRKEVITLTIALWLRWATHQCRLWALPPIGTITSEVWNQVSKRDWKSNPLSGAEPPATYPTYGDDWGAHEESCDKTVDHRVPCTCKLASNY